MRFALVAVVAIAWSLAVLRWSFSRRPSRGLIVFSTIAGVAAAISIVTDLRAIWLRRTAPDSHVAIVVNEIGGWWQLQYRRGSTVFITANEIHVPTKSVVTITWNGATGTVWRSHDFLPLEQGRFSFVAEKSGNNDILLLRAWPPVSRSVRIIADPPPAFNRWFDQEARPARSDATGAELFTSSGCAYCHVIRGVAESPWKIAPDLSHFANRRTIASIGLPNRRGFLSGWIVNSHTLKRSSEMPENALDPAVLHRLLTYLQSLH